MNKRLLINLSATMASFIVNVVINFVITRYIIRNLGEGAYGFIGLANNFVCYAGVVTVALNSVAGRFITIKIHQNKIEDANIYFNSVLLSNIIMSLIILAVSSLMILNLESIIKIPNNLVFDVRITFIIVFANFILSVLTSIFTVATFVRNRLELTAIKTIISNVIRLIILFLLFFLFKTKIYYIGIAAVFATLYVGISNFKYTKELLPELRIDISKFSVKAIKDLISLGVWNSLSSLSNILLSGLDLFIANIFVNASDMGLLSIAETVPMLVSAFVSAIVNVFSPKFTILYAKGEMGELVKEIKLSIKILGLLTAVPLAGFVIFGIDFFTLWLPSLSSGSIVKVQILSILTIGPTFISAFVFSLYSLNTITNNMKVPVTLTLVISVISTLTVIILLKTTNLGVYAIAGVSTILILFRVILFVPMYAAHTLKIKLTTFYRPLLTGLFSFGVLCVVFYFIEKNITIQSWLKLAIVAIPSGCLGYIINYSIILNKDEKRLVNNKIRRILYGKFKKQISNV